MWFRLCQGYRLQTSGDMMPGSRGRSGLNGCSVTELRIARGGAVLMTSDAEREANIAVVRRVAEEVLSRGNLSVVDETFVPEIGARWKQSVVTLRAAFPDWRFTIEEALAVDDKVVIRATVRGTHTGTPY